MDLSERSQLLKLLSQRTFHIQHLIEKVIGRPSQAKKKQISGKSKSELIRLIDERLKIETSVKKLLSLVHELSSGKHKHSSKASYIEPEPRKSSNNGNGRSKKKTTRRTINSKSSSRLRYKMCAIIGNRLFSIYDGRTEYVLGQTVTCPYVSAQSLVGMQQDAKHNNNNHPSHSPRDCGCGFYCYNTAEEALAATVLSCLFISLSLFSHSTLVP